MNSLEDILLEVWSGFHLSRLCGADKAALVEHLRDPEIAGNTLAIPYPYTEADADWWIEHCAQHARDPEIQFALREPRGGLVGQIGIVGGLSGQASEAEFGYWLARPHRGQGIMSRTIEVFAVHAFERLGLKRLIATPFALNIASRRCLVKAGFRREGVLRNHHRKGDKLIDAVLYARRAEARHPSNAAST